MATGRIHSFETFGSVDGPGIRFVVFLQGCKMRCLYCHNPDTWKMEAGEEKTVEQIVKQALRYRTYWGKDGGVTCSGGEPLLQIDFMIELFKALKQEGVHTTIDTCGAPFTREEPFLSKFNELMKYTDLIMLDLKHINNEKHIELTHLPNVNILDCAKYLDELHKDVWIRHVLVPGYTDDEVYLTQLSDFIKTLSNVKRIEVLPYHSFGAFKYEEMGIPYKLKDTQTPTAEREENAKRILGVQSFKEYEASLKKQPHQSSKKTKGLVIVLLSFLAQAQGQRLAPGQRPDLAPWRQPQR